ncbi:hypothetical protein AURDEDRAFT_181602 [Auricularia subglabra TFB-10046 SS5]|nr:hypothetical protein AURDEDRAFT_181602 [Auricularia subglabra TFB-10046 SS5]
MPAVHTVAHPHIAQYVSSPTLPGLPRHVVVMIGLYLDTWTLVHLSRTSKRLRAKLLSTKNEQLWVVAREAEFALRCKRPKDLSEAAWTTLLCYKRCHVCHQTALRVLWSVHLRLCDGCEALLKAQHLAGGGTEETYSSMFQISNAFATRPTRRQLRSKLIEDIEAARPPPTAQQSPLQIVTHLWNTYLTSHGADPHDPLESGRFVPLPRDVLSSIQNIHPSVPLSPLRLTVRALDFPFIFRIWVRYVQNGLMNGLPKSIGGVDPDAARCVWSPISKAQQYLHPPAWWPHAAHLYMHISKPKGESTPRKSPQELLRFDDRASAAVQSLLQTFGLADSTTVGALDAMDLYVQCAACAPDGPAERDGLVYHWRHAVSHACTMHQGGPPRWRVLNSTHAVLAGRRDRVAACATPMWKCGLCAWASRRAVCRAAIEAHLARVHELRPDEVVVGEHLYAHPGRDSLHGLAKPICQWELLEDCATLSVNGPSLTVVDANLNPDPMVSPTVTDTAAPDGESVYIFCLWCPVRTRRRHFAQAEGARAHFREQHGTDIVVLGCDYDYL